MDVDGKYDSISGSSLTSKYHVTESLAGSGLASPMKTSYYDLVQTWILAWNVLPQPINYVGVWDDTDVWDDTSYWYD